MTLKAQQPTPSAPDVATGSAPDGGTPATGGSGTALRHGWTVQLGSFANKSNAEALVRRVRADKVPVFVSSTGSGRSLRFRVRAGPLPDRAAAQRTLMRLKKEGHAGTLVAP